MQVEKHNVNGFPGLPILMVLDVWEHAYYLDYRNDRAKFVDAHSKFVNIQTRLISNHCSKRWKTRRLKCELWQ
jgi:superoxide dismutase